jgi:4-amino-4-deoxy-L-arabinose transferase-like glycosyltransferase
MRYEPWTEITASGLGFFLGGLFLVLFAARAFLGLLRVRLRHPVDGLAAYWVSGAAVVAGSVFLAGKTGLLFLPGILLIQAVALLVLLFAGRQRPTDVLRHLRDDLFSAGKTVAGLLRRPPRGRIPRLAWLLGLLLAVVLVELLVVGILTPDLNHDTNRYRLPRMGLWLQNNHIGHSNVPVVWMNAQGRIYEFLGIGLVSFFPSGFPLMHLISWVAGSALVASTYGLARRLRLPRLLRWAGIFVLLGQANVLVQFTTTQTDLTSAAFAAAGMLFVWDALKTVRTSSFILAGLAFGLAVGTKQTVLAWGPGFAVLALLWGWQFCTPWKKILRPATLAFFVGLPFCLPLFAENHRWYGDWLVPKSALQKFPSLKPEEKVRPLFYPAVVLWHLSWPAVQSPLLAPATEWMHGRAFEAMKASTLVGKGNGVPACAENLKEWMRDRFHEDIVPPSWPVYFFALGGALLLAVRLGVRRRWPVAPAATLAAGAGVFWVCGLNFGWEIYSWRYWLIPAPMLTLAAVSLPLWAGVGKKPDKNRMAWAALWLLLHLPVLFRGLWLHGNNGLLTLLHPEKAASQGMISEMRRASAILDRQPRRLLVSTKGDLHGSFLFRRPVPHHITFSQQPWLWNARQPLPRFLAESGADTALISWNPPDHGGLRVEPIHIPGCSELWLVRLLKPGEIPQDSLKWKEGHDSDEWIGKEARLSLRQWPSSQLPLRLQHYFPENIVLTVTGRTGTRQWTLPPQQWLEYNLPVRSDDEIHFQCDRVLPPQGKETRSLGVRIVIPPRPPF